MSSNNYCESVFESSNIDCDKEVSHNSQLLDIDKDYIECDASEKEEKHFFIKGKDIFHQNRFKSSFKIIKKWEGCIEEINGNDIIAKLFDDEDYSYDIFEFDIKNVSFDDKKMVKKGALFFFYLAHYTDDKGTTKRDSYFKFRRFPVDDDFINDGLDTMNNLKFDDFWE